jgi:hypothetical protein
VSEAYEGFAAYKGVAKGNPDVPDEESRRALRARLEREAKVGDGPGN